MSESAPVHLQLELRGIAVSCRLDGRNDRRLLRYLADALDDARSALAEGFDAAQELSWKLGGGSATLSVGEQCGADVLARVAGHVALLGGEPVDVGVVASRKDAAPAPRREADPGQPAVAAGTDRPAPAKPAPEADQGSGGESDDDASDNRTSRESDGASAPGRSRLAEASVPAFTDFNEALAALEELVKGGARGDVAERSWAIVRDSYGLGQRRYSQEELAAALDLSKQGVAQNLVRSLERVKDDALLAARLKATVAERADVLWDFLDELCGGVVGEAELESLPRLLDQAVGRPHGEHLSAWALCFQAAHLGGTMAVAERRAALAGWLETHGAKVGECLVSARLDADEMGRVLAGLDSLVTTWRLPQSLEFLAGQMGVAVETLETALSWRGPALKVMVSDGLVCSSRAGAQVQRAHRLALMMAVNHAGAEQGLYDLAEDYAEAFPDDPVDPKSVFFAVGDNRGAPHLFLPTAVTGWRGLFEGGEQAEERLLDLSAHAKAHAVDDGRGTDDAGRDAEVLALFERHGPMSALALGKLAEEELDLKASLVGLVIHQSGRIVRVGPRLFGLPDQRQVLADGGELPKSFLEPEVLQAAAYGVRTGEQRFLFPCWSEKLEKALREVAEEQAHELSLRWGRVIDPGYNCAKIFGEIKATPKQSARKASPDAVLAAALHLAEYGRVSVASLNLLGRSRATVLSADGASLMTALAALGVIAGEEPWFNAHLPGPLHEAAIEALTTARFRAGELDWNQPEARAFLERAAGEARDADWMSRGSAGKLVELVGAGAD